MRMDKMSVSHFHGGIYIVAQVMRHDINELFRKSIFLARWLYPA